MREIERGGAAASATLWAELEALGLGSALLTEDDGGAGLGFADLAPLVRLMGRYLLPVPLAETMVARGLLARGGSANAGEGAGLPSGPVALAAGASTHAGDIFCSAVPLAQTAELVLLALPGIEGAGKEQVVLTPLRDAEVTPTEVHGSLAATLRWRTEPGRLATIELPAHALRDLAATLHAAQMASAMDHLLEMTVEYAGVRQQFGKPLARFQALPATAGGDGRATYSARTWPSRSPSPRRTRSCRRRCPAALAQQYVSAVSSEVTEHRQRGARRHRAQRRVRPAALRPASVRAASGRRHRIVLGATDRRGASGGGRIERRLRAPRAGSVGARGVTETGVIDVVIAGSRPDGARPRSTCSVSADTR